MIPPPHLSAISSHSGRTRAGARHGGNEDSAGFTEAQDAPRSQPSRGDTGFTLIELMVALLILALLLAIAHVSLEFGPNPDKH